MSSQTDTRPDPLPADTTDDDLATVAEDFLDAMLAAASVDVIGVANWWPRATSALTAAAASATSVRDMVTIMSGKLQIETLPEQTARTITRIEAAVADPAVFARWRRIAERDAVYVAGMVKIRRADKREARKQENRQKPAASTAANDEGCMF